MKGEELVAWLIGERKKLSGPQAACVGTQQRNEDRRTMLLRCATTIERLQESERRALSHSNALVATIARSGFDISPCRGCGEDVVCAPAGTPRCVKCKDARCEYGASRGGKAGVNRVFIQGEPAGKPRADTCGKRRFIPDTTKAGNVHPHTTWRELVMLEMRPHAPAQPWEGPVHVSIEAVFTRPCSHFVNNGKSKRTPFKLKADAPRYFCTRKPDRDNLDKAILDAMTALQFWRDDDQVCTGAIIKRWAQPGEPTGVWLDFGPVPDAEPDELLRAPSLVEPPVRMELRF